MKTSEADESTVMLGDIMIDDGRQGAPTVEAVLAARLADLYLSLGEAMNARGVTRLEAGNLELLRVVLQSPLVNVIARELRA